MSSLVQNDCSNPAAHVAPLEKTWLGYSPNPKRPDDTLCQVLWTPHLEFMNKVRVQRSRATAMAVCRHDLRLLARLNIHLEISL